MPITQITCQVKWFAWFAWFAQFAKYPDPKYCAKKKVSAFLFIFWKKILCYSAGALGSDSFKKKLISTLDANIMASQNCALYPGQKNMKLR